MKNLLTNFLELLPVEEFSARYAASVADESFFGFPIEPILKAERDLRSPSVSSVGYFSMEYGLSTNTYNVMQAERPVSDSNVSTDHHVFSNLRAMDYYLTLDAAHRLDLPIYSGGLGVLAGDTLKSAADRRVPLAAVGILWNKGYFKQSFWFKDGQVPEETNWDPLSFPGLVPLTTSVEVQLKRETIRLKLWKYFVYSSDRKHVVPLVLLDSNVPENSAPARELTGQLYRSDNAEWKALQRAVLGLGGMKALDACGYKPNRYHLNEGHAALAFVEKARGASDAEIQALKKHFAYTCHTPVAAGHDRFQKKLLQELLDEADFQLVKKFGQDAENGDLINLTRLAMETCHFVNAVAEKHGEVTRLQFPAYAPRIRSITNGVHTYTWASKPFERLFDRHDAALGGGWRSDPSKLANALKLNADAAFRKDLWEAHQANKRGLASLLKSWRIDPDVFTVGWARRIAAYKRPSMILQSPEKLLELARNHGPIQILMAGKAHPKDDLGFTYVNEMLSAIDSLAGHRGLVRVLMLENYDTYFGKILTSSVDVWLNNPLPPLEASGTSGMKAILNGVLQLSTLDGWVVEAEHKNLGWIFGWRHEGNVVGDERDLRLKEDAERLYSTLDEAIGLYYRTNKKGVVDYGSEWITKMVQAVGAAAFFSTDRMVGQYEKEIWRG